MLWDSQKIIDAFPEFNVKIGYGPGGDWDLLPLYFRHPDRMGMGGIDPEDEFGFGEEEDWIIATPFIDPNDRAGCKDPAAAQEVYAVELRNRGSDSRGGCQTDDEAIAVMYGIILARLGKMGFDVIRHCDEIF